MDSSITTRIIQDQAGWDSIQNDWNQLHAASPAASAPLDFVWLQNWWQVYGAVYGTGGLQIITAWRGPQLIAAIPLYAGIQKSGAFGAKFLRFISTGEDEAEETCADYLNMLYLPGEEATAGLLWEEIRRMDWDALELLDMPQSTPLAQKAQSHSRGKCPIADLTGGFEAYLDRLSSNSRQQARRMMREGDRAGVQLEIAGVDQWQAMFDDMVRLHQQRWTSRGKPGVFAAVRFVEFHRSLIQQWLPSGRAVLARLSLAGEAVAVLYGFVTAGKFDFYQSGMKSDDAVPLKSPGILAHLLLMKELSQRGATEYDFLRGSSSYKERLATRENELIGIRIWRPTLRTAAFQSSRIGAKIVRKAFRLIGRAKP